MPSYMEHEHESDISIGAVKLQPRVLTAASLMNIKVRWISNTEMMHLMDVKQTLLSPRMRFPLTTFCANSMRFSAQLARSCLQQSLELFIQPEPDVFDSAAVTSELTLSQRCNGKCKPMPTLCFLMSVRTGSEPEAGPKQQPTVCAPDPICASCRYCL